MSSEASDGNIVFRRSIYFAILCGLQLLNYIDRFGLATALTDVQKYYDVQDKEGGMVMTAFLISATVSSPLFGYLGERYRRKSIIAWTVLLRIASVFMSSYVPKNLFPVFVFCRILLGCGNCAFTVIAPLIIADIFPPEMRSNKYAIFFLMTPVGSGFGHIIGSKTSVLFNDFTWGLRWSPIVGALLLVLLLVYGFEEKRNSNCPNDKANKKDERQSFVKNIFELLSNPTFVSLTCAATMVVSIMSVLAWWLPSTMVHAEASINNKTRTSELSVKDKDFINTTFGIIYMFGGIIGVVVGTSLGNMLKSGRLLCGRKLERGDPIVCSLGTAIALCIFSYMPAVIKRDQEVAFILISFGTVALCLNWSINADLLMSIVEPNKRSTAYSLQVFLESLLDCVGPFIVGLISDAFRTDRSPTAHCDSLLKALTIPIVMIGIACIMYVVTAITLPNTHRKLKNELKQPDVECSSKYTETKE